MQDINDQNVEESSTKANTAPSREIAIASRKSNLRSRYALKSTHSTNSAPIENIGEIKLDSGETLKDDLTENMGAAKAKRVNRGEDSHNTGRSPNREHQGDGRDRRSSGENREGRERRRRGGRERGRRRDREGDTAHSKPNKDKEKRFSRHGTREPQRKEFREKTHGSSQANRPTRQRKNRGSADNEVKPATWNAMDSDSEGGFFKKAGKLLSSIFGGSKDEDKTKSSEPSKKRANYSKGRRRRRSRGGNRGQQSGGQPRS